MVLVLGGMLYFYATRLGALPRIAWRWIWGLRALFTMLLFALLMDPQITWRRLIQAPPRVAIILDNSLSMSNHASASTSTVYAQVVSAINWAVNNQYEPWGCKPKYINEYSD